jgi:hypothetical protein
VAVAVVMAVDLVAVLVDTAQMLVELLYRYLYKLYTQ